jgi:3-phosphoshikimate 1-carboxyvinyltransferase
MANISLSKLPAFRGTVTIPGDKSISHRAAILATIANGRSTIDNYSSAIDCQTTLKCLQMLGADITHSDQQLIINGKGLKSLTKPDHILDCGNSGTTMRLLCGLLAGQNFPAVLNGDESLLRRPMERVIKPLNQNGAEIYGSQTNRFAPLDIHGRALPSIFYHLPVASSQVKSALLLAGLYTRGKVQIEEPVVSRDHTERMLEFCGVDIKRDGYTISLGTKRQPGARYFQIPGDVSSAAFLMALALLIPESQLRIENIGINPTRTGLLTVLKAMGSKIKIENQRLTSNEPVGDLIVRSGVLKGTEIGGEIIPRLIDELPLIAVIATQAKGQTVVKNAAELRVKETDRIQAIVTELTKMGAVIKGRPDGFIVEGPVTLKGATCDSYGDHRIAMALSVAGWIAEGQTTITNTECVGISFPEFYQIVAKLSGLPNPN